MSREPVHRAPHDHLVHFYRTDAELDRAVSEHLLEGLRDGCSGLLIGSPARRERFERSLGATGVEALIAAGRYHAADAQETLEQFMIYGRPDPARFNATVGAVVARAVAGGAPLRAFGEMVALLWNVGNVSGAIHLEELWNDLATEHSFSLYCAYPMASLEAADDLVSAQRVCMAHSGVISPSPRTSWPPNRDRQSTLFAPSAAAANHARRFVAAVLSQWDCDALKPDAVLVTSELASNSVRHAHSAFRVSLMLSPRLLRIEVHDTDRDRPQRRDAAPADTSGRGMAIVEGLAARTGTQVHEAGKIIWAELSRT